MHSFRILNVFTLPGDRLSGNPLCVFEDGRGHSDDAISDELLPRHGYPPDRQEAMAYLWSRGTPEWTVRFFFTADGAVREDPATGSACANLGGWHVARGHPLPMSATLRQGDAVGRPSRLGLRVDAGGGIFVSGEVVELGRGTIDLG
jgi:predicted PhzF superfamily epimerase YddE/YHI9